MASSKIPVALVGGGTIAPLHAQYLQSSPVLELVAIIDPFPPGEKLAQELGVSHFKSVSLLLQGLTGRLPEAYIVCVPSSLHMSVSQEVIEQASPKAILIEKPFSTDSKSGSKLVELARQKNCTVLVGHHRRFHPSMTAAKEVIESGRLGHITAVSGLWAAKKNEGYYTVAPWRISRSAGGGPIWTNFVHDVDILHYLMGSIIVRIWATPTPTHRTHAADIDKTDLVEEGAAIMMQFANGSVGTFIVSDNVSSPHGWESATGDNPSYAKSVAPVDTYRIMGTNGTLSEPDGVLWTYRPEDAQARGLEVGWNIPMVREEVRFEDAIPFEQQAKHFARVIQGIEEPRCSGDDGLAAVKVCEAITEALTRCDGIPVVIQ